MPMAAAVRAITPQALKGENVLSGVAAAILALVVGALAVRSTQAGVALTLLVLLLAVRSQSRSGGLMLLWTYWLLAPLLRRVLELSVGAPSADPLSLLPFLGTAILAVMELREDRLDGRARRILGLAGVGIMLGLLTGLAADPPAAGFAAVAYGSGLAAFVLGWGDGVRRLPRPTLYKALAIGLLPLSLYAIAQYFYPLPSWDAHWVDAGGLGSLGAPQEGHIRVFSSLNSPFTFAIALVAGILLGLGRRRRLSQASLATIPLIVALALTFMRSAWLALVAGLLVFAGAVRGKTAGRVVVVIIVCLVGLIIVGHGNSTTRAFTERITSLGSPGSDVSTQARLERTNQLLPVAIGNPVGAGLGQAGLASERLGGTTQEFLTNVDDGYLSMLYQSGPFGFLLLAAALISSVAAAVRGLGRAADAAERQARAALLATIVMLLVALAAGDALFGLPGAILWYLCGLAVARSREGAPTTVGEPSMDG
jgi:hypothetical protein